MSLPPGQRIDERAFRATVPRAREATRLSLASADGAGRDSKINPSLEPKALMTRCRMFALGVISVLSIAACQSSGYAPPQTDPAARLGPSQFSIVPPTLHPLRITADRDLAISPDGMRVVYVAGAIGDTARLMVRAINRPEAVGLRGTNFASSPFYSPDGQWIGFFAEGEIRKVAISGGSPITLCRIRGGARGASWGSNDTIVFATSAARTGLWSVPASGGEPRVLTVPDSMQGESAHQFPAILPSGRAVLFTIQAIGTPVLSNIVFAPLAGIGVLDVNTGTRKRLIFRGSQAVYTESRYLVFAGVGTLQAVGFDLAHLEVVGDPEVIVDHVMTKLSSAADFSVSGNGTLVYVPGGAGGQEWKPRELVWVNRKDGVEAPIHMPSHNYGLPRVSPDGARVAVNMIDAVRGNYDHGIGVWDFVSGRLTQLSMLDIATPVWTSDGKRIVFATQWGDVRPANLYSQSSEGSGPVERLTTSPSAQLALSSLPDGKGLLIIEQQQDVPGADWHLSVLPAERAQASAIAVDPRNEPLIHNKSGLLAAEVSPDGHWLTYTSNESGRSEVYVRPFPSVGDGTWQISSGGASEPTWARSERELFYLDATGLLTVVPVQTSPILHAGAPATVLHTRYFSTGNFAPLRNYDVSPDGQRFLMVKDPPATMVVVRRWVDLFKRRPDPVGGTSQ